MYGSGSYDEYIKYFNESLHRMNEDDIINNIIYIDAKIEELEKERLTFQEELNNRNNERKRTLK